MSKFWECSGGYLKWKTEIARYDFSMLLSGTGGIRKDRECIIPYISHSYHLMIHQFYIITTMGLGHVDENWRHKEG